MKVLVTGGSGFLGGHVIPLLCERGFEVQALARNDRAAQRVQGMRAVPIRGDLEDADGLMRAFGSSGAETLVNLASLGFGHTGNILDATKGAGISRAIFISTTSIFTTLDARTKPIRLQAEEAIKESGLEWTILRPTMIYGAPGDRNMERLIKLLRKTSIVPVPGGGTGLQQPVHVDDLAQAVVAATELSEAAAAFEIAGPEPLSLRAIIQQTGKAVGKKVKILPLPLGPIVALASICERISKKPRIKAEQFERLAEDKAFDITAARKALNYNPRSFAEGVFEEVQMFS